MRTARLWWTATLIGCLPSVSPTVPLSAQDSIPVGFGTLRRDDIAVRLSTGQVEIQVLPLDEQVIRLLASDTYRSLRSLVQSRQPDLTEAAQRAGIEAPPPVLVMVSFFGLVPQARFAPEDLTITSRGRQFRPAGIVPISATWSSYRLDAREQAVALYLFESGIGFREQLTVTYEGRSSDAWTRSLQALDRERARVRSRAQSTPAPSDSTP